MNWTATQINPFTQEVDQHHIFIEPGIAVIERKIEGHDADDLPNAQLIASAPELLKALKLMRGWVMHKLEPIVSGSGAPYEALIRDMEIASKAIEKATGGNEQ